MGPYGYIYRHMAHEMVFCVHMWHVFSKKSLIIVVSECHSEPFLVPLRHEMIDFMPLSVVI